VTARAEPDTFLALLSDADREALLALGGPRRFDRGEHLMHQGEPGGQVLLLLQGHTKATFVDPRVEEMVLSFRGPGDVLGELSFVQPEPRSSGVIAIDPVEARALAAAGSQPRLPRGEVGSGDDRPQLRAGAG
jgi:CRP-like cAMP-binding protein